ncbi:hypothetical protein GQ607_002472 [Colletotrichum asianum]|uniref:Uncharacterized protein n=1 Tax=Colletotrichum asianum TaxID=702518 RepID=A0A8H3ZW42_9PEZI|nr:hypothetical protein GQ607_002472 [Colletotrichum asianum]
MDATQRAQSICSPTIEEEIAVAIEPQNCCHPLQLAQQEKTNHLVRHQHRHRHRRRPWLCRRCLAERPVFDASATPLVRTSDPCSPHLETMYLPQLDCCQSLPPAGEACPPKQIELSDYGASRR